MMAQKTAQAKKTATTKGSGATLGKNTTPAAMPPEEALEIRRILGVYPSFDTPLPPYVGAIHIAACTYCGQTREVGSRLFHDRDKAEEYVAGRCSCAGAQAHQAALKQEMDRELDLSRAEKQLIEMLGEGAPGYGKIPVLPENLEYLYTGAVAVYDGILKNITVDVCDGVKVKVTKTAKGNLKLTRSDTSTFTQEV